jgi:hypothetical protein
LPEVEEVEKLLDGPDVPLARDDLSRLVFPFRFVADGRK